MTRTETKPLNVLAPAKINLYLHITGRRDDGYHELDSLMAFADIGDRVRIKPAREFSFSITGPFARAFTAGEKKSGPDSQNLAVKAAWALAKALGKEPDFDIKLTKNLPLAAGLGGGSANAAATIWAMLEYWNIPARNVPCFDRLLLSLGADVPACMACEAVRAAGIGEKLSSAPGIGELPVILVNPGKRCPTAKIFSRYQGPFSDPAPDFTSDQDLVSYLTAQRNDLTEAAMDLTPDIKNVLAVLEKQENCQLARMSGSGATCFGLFPDDLAALDAAENITCDYPDWWIRAGVLNRPRRY